MSGGEAVRQCGGAGEDISARKVMRASRPEGTRVAVGSVTVGGGEFIVMAGSCAIEGAAQVNEVAAAVARAGAQVLRGGAFKPRTSPYAFQGLGEPGLRLLRDAGRSCGLPIVSEVLEPGRVEQVAEQVDLLQVGARNMQNFPLLRALARVQRPVLLKRGFSNTIEEWLLAAEYLLDGGNEQVILCERGIRTFETATRNTLDLSAVVLAKQQSHLPVIVDPSHATGVRELVVPLSLAAAACGADGLLVEVHPRPETALCDGRQALTVEQFQDLMGRLKAVLTAVGRAPKSAGAHPTPTD